AVRSVAMIAVDVLADQRDFAHARLGEPRRLGDDLHHRPRGFRAARIGHDAERTELVAAFLDGDEGGHAARTRCRAARRRQEVELVLDWNLGVHERALLRYTRQERGKSVIALRPEDEIDGGSAADDLLALGLCGAARDRDRHTAAGLGGLLLEHTDA